MDNHEKNQQTEPQKTSYDFFLSRVFTGVGGFLKIQCGIILPAVA
jgi:hypothetical protein